jgi:hypothetical protein
VSGIHELPVDLRIPGSLKVPTGHSLFFRAYGKGAQIYTCPDVRNPTPFAILRTSEGDEAELVAIHYGGLIWEATDGSVFIGDATRQQQAAAPDSDSIPWLLIPAKSTNGSGLLSRVTYIQRVQTRGGQMPLSSCTERPSGAQFLIAYVAQYIFYVAAS